MRCAARKRRERNEAEHEAAVMELVRDKFRTCEMRYGIVFFLERHAPPTSDVGVVSTARHPRLATVLDKLREVKTQLGANAELMTALQQALETQLTLMRPLIQAHRESLRRT